MYNELSHPAGSPKRRSVRFCGDDWIFLWNDKGYLQTTRRLFVPEIYYCVNNDCLAVQRYRPQMTSTTFLSLNSGGTVLPCAIAARICDIMSTVRSERVAMKGLEAAAPCP